MNEKLNFSDKSKDANNFFMNKCQILWTGEIGTDKTELYLN